MKRKTIKDYQNSILEKFNNDIEEGKAKYLTKTSPALIRNACLKCLNEEKINLSDKKMLFSFFEKKEDENIIDVIKKYPTGKLKSVGKFIQKGTDPKREGIDELVAWLVDFHPRPFSTYRTQDSKNSSRDNGFSQKDELNNDSKGSFKKRDDIRIQKSKSNRFFKVIATLVVLILIPLSFLVYSVAKSTYFIKQDIEHMRKISTNELSNYLKDNNQIWQGVSLKGDVEYFTSSGKHPETGNGLTMVTNKEIKEIVKETRFVKPVIETQGKEEGTIVSNTNKGEGNRMAIFMFSKDVHLNNKVRFRLQNQVFKDYKISAPSTVNQDVLENNLKSGNVSFLEDTFIKNTDYICVGSLEHSFRTSTINSQIIICDLDLSYTVYNEQGVIQSSLSKSDIYTGQGFGKLEALKNSIKKIK